MIREIKMVLDHYYKIVPGESGINVYDFEMKLGRNELVSRRYRVSQSFFEEEIYHFYAL